MFQSKLSLHFFSIDRISPIITKTFFNVINKYTSRESLDGLTLLYQLGHRRRKYHGDQETRLHLLAGYKTAIDSLSAILTWHTGGIHARASLRYSYILSIINRDTFSSNTGIVKPMLLHKSSLIHVSQVNKYSILH